MELRLGFTGIRRGLDLRGLWHGLGRYRNALVIMLSALLVLGVTLALLRPAAIPDLAHGNARGFAAVSAAWARGDMIVLVRHAERCDHAKAPCLDRPDGITERAQPVALGLGERFKGLGLDHTDIYSSPLTRAVQTSILMFGHASYGQDWLSNCRSSLLRDALLHKVAGRNLVLVTHSECMASLEHSLKVPNPSLGYGASLFVSAPPASKPAVMGFIEAADWPSLTGQ